MSTFTFRVVLAVSILVLATTVAAGVVAATQPSGDEQALQPIRQPADRRVESRVNDLLAKMTLEEKLQQIQLLPDFLVTDEGVKKGLGSVLSVTDPQRIRDLQRMAVEESRLKIPILFAFDTIHGFRTVFPIPLAAGASFDPQVAVRRPHLRRTRVGRRRAQADLRPDGRRLARTALGQDLRSRGRGPVPELGARGCARQGDPGIRLQRARQARRQPQALRRLRPARERPRLQHHRHVRAAAVELLSAAVQGRHRRRRGHCHVLVQRDQRRARAAATTS